MSRLRHLAGAGALGLTAFLAADLAADIVAARKVDAALAGLRAAGITAARGQVDTSLVSGRVRVSDLRLHVSERALSIGAIAFDGPSPLAARAQSGSVTLSDVTFKIGPMNTYTIPSIRVNGSSLAAGDLERLMREPFGPGTLRLVSSLNASSIEVPSVRLTSEAPTPDGPVKTDAIYEGIRFDDVKNGVIARFSGTKGVFSASAPQNMQFTGSMGALAGQTIDLAQMLRIYFESARDGEALKPVIGGYTADGIRMEGPDGLMIEFGQIRSGPLRARPLKIPLVEVVRLAQAAQPGAQLPEAEQKRLGEMLADLVNAFESDALGETSNIRARGKGKDGKTFDVSLASLRYGALAKGRLSEFALEGLQVSATDGRVGLGRFALTGLDMGPLFSAMPDFLGQTPAAMAALDWRRAVPRLEGVTVRDIDIDVPDKDGTAGVNGRVKAKLGLFDIKLGNYVAAVPTALRKEVQGLKVTLPDTPQSKDLIALGYRDLDLSGLVDARWTEAERSFTLGEASAAGAGMGAVKLGARLGNVPRELFSGDMGQMQVAALGLTAHSASVRIENAGLFDRLLAAEARKRNTSPEAIRAEVSMAVEMLLTGTLGPSPTTEQIVQALKAFIARPGSLSVSARAKAPGGIGLVQFMAIQSPAQVLDLVDVTATANQ